MVELDSEEDRVLTPAEVAAILGAEIVDEITSCPVPAPETVDAVEPVEGEA